jgi:hypothetical protein
VLLYAEQLGEVVGRGGEAGRLLGRGRFHRQPGGRDDLVDRPPARPKVGLAAACRGCFRNLLLVTGRQLLFATALARDFELVLPS